MPPQAGERPANHRLSRIITVYSARRRRRFQREIPPPRKERIIHVLHRRRWERTAVLTGAEAARRSHNGWPAVGLQPQASPFSAQFLAAQRISAAQLYLLRDNCPHSCLHAFCCAISHRTAPSRRSAHAAHPPRPKKLGFATCSALRALLPCAAPCGSGTTFASQTTSGRVPRSACLSRVAPSHATLALASLSFSRADESNSGAALSLGDSGLTR